MTSGTVVMAVKKRVLPMLRHISGSVNACA